MSNSIIEKNQYRYIFIGFIIFSIVYWIAALSKLFNFQEYFSYVYAQKTGFLDILLLYDTGIGHPPFYHLIQRAILSLSPFPTIFNIRVANFFIGFPFIYILFKLIGQNKKHIFFFFSLFFSAAIFNAFVYSRMWALVLLFATLVLYYGERLINKGEKGDRIALLVFSFLGIFSDYNFFLFIPYITWVLFARTKWLPVIVWIQFILALMILIILFWLKFNGLTGNLSLPFYTLFINIIKVMFAQVNAFYFFNFYEILIAALFLTFASLGVYVIKNINDEPVTKRYFNPLIIMAYLMLITICHVLLENDVIATRYIFIPFLIITVAVIYHFFIESKPDLNKQNVRFIFSMLVAIIMVQAINPWFWTDLTRSRYFLIFVPFLSLLILNNFPKITVNIVSVILLISGLIYFFSNRVDEIYPPSYINTEQSILFRSPSTFSTQYILNSNQFEKDVYIMDDSQFVNSCRVCSMGTNEVPFERLNSFLVVKEINVDLEKEFPEDFKRVKTRALNLSTLDQFMFKYLYPIINTRYSLEEYQRKAVKPDNE